MMSMETTRIVEAMAALAGMAGMTMAMAGMTRMAMAMAGMAGMAMAAMNEDIDKGENRPQKRGKGRLENEAYPTVG